MPDSAIELAYPLDSASAAAASGIPRNFFEHIVRRDGVPWAPPVEGRSRMWSRADCVCLSLLNELSQARAIDMRRSWQSSIPLVAALNPLLRRTRTSQWQEWAEVHEYRSGAYKAEWPRRFPLPFQSFSDVPIVSRTLYPVFRVGRDIDQRLTVMNERARISMDLEVSESTAVSAAK